MKSFYYEAFARNPKFYINQALQDYFANKTSNEDVLNISFDGENFREEINFKELLLEVCENNQDEDGFRDFRDYLNGKNDKFKLVMSFDKAIFNIYPNFDGLRCHKLSFNNTVFEKGAKLRWINVDDVVYRPRKLGMDVTFASKGYSDLDNNLLYREDFGEIGKFNYRHAIEGSGFTFFVGVKFAHRADFTNAMLDKVHFAQMDMSKCFFANSIIEDTRFYNCDFYFEKDAYFPLVKDYTNRPLAMLLSMILFWAAIYLSLSVYIFLGLFVVILFSHIILMPIFDLFGIFFRGIFDSNANCHIATADDVIMIQEQTKQQQENNYKTIREIYRQLKVNFEKHGDYQTAGDFYYSQRYCELINYHRNTGFQWLQSILFNMHYSINGFGERWLRAFVWFLLIIFGFAFFGYTPNEDFISTKSTPEYFLNAHNENNVTTSQIHYNHASIAGSIADMKKTPHFMEIATTSYKDNEKKDMNKTFYAFDNRFDFYYTSQFVPVLKTDNNFDLKLTHSLSKMIAPFISEEKKWFQDRSKKAYYLGFLETILLWIFFLAFVFAVKNRIRR